MGAQVAALLASRVSLGEARAVEVNVTARLAVPDVYDLDRVARAHGGCGFAPTSWDGQVLTTVLPDGTSARVLPSLEVELSAAGDLGPLRHVLDLDRDVTELWDVTEPWVRQVGAGRQLRASSSFEAMCQALAATNTSYRSSQRMLRELVGAGPFPAAAAVIGRELTTWGYRTASLQALARAVDDGLCDRWEHLDDDELQAAIRLLPGFGPFAAASVLPLLGRPRPFVLDGWLASQVRDPRRFAALGRWAGEALWLEVSRSWLGPPPAAALPRSPGAPVAAHE